MTTLQTVIFCIAWVVIGLQVAAIALLRRRLLAMRKQADAIFLCHFRSEPDDTECYEAMWSEFSECADCPVECYRRGWDVAACEVDNLRRVERKGREAR